MSADGIQPAKLAVGLQAKDARLVRRKNARSFGEGKRNIFPSTPVILAYSATRANYITHYANRIRLAFVSQPRLRFSPFLVLVDVVFRAARRAAPPRIATTNAQSPPVFLSLSSSSPTFTVCASVLHPPPTTDFLRNVRIFVLTCFFLLLFLFSLWLLCCLYETCRGILIVGNWIRFGR